MGAKVDGKHLKEDETNRKGLGKKNGGGVKGERVAASVVTSMTANAEPAWENPLVPNAVLREMYRKMVEIRILQEQARQPGRGSIAKSKRGQEACRVSVAQGLESGDLVMDSQPGALMGYLLGADLAHVLRSIGTSPKVPAKKGAAGKKQESTNEGANQVLPFVKETEARVFAGLGAALLLKSLKRTDGVVIYLEPRQAGNGLYRQALTLAATLGLAVIFFVLPDSRRGKAKLRTKVITVAHKCSVPAMTVEASDAIALYRVVQESLGRFRAGGGPVLIEGVTFPASAGDVPLNDPVEQLGRYLLNRRLCTEDWVAATKRSFRKRLATAKRS